MLNWICDLKGRGNGVCLFHVQRKKHQVLLPAAVGGDCVFVTTS